MTTTMTAVEVMKKLYDAGPPCDSEVRNVLCAWADLDMLWHRWDMRCDAIWDHKYKRDRDAMRAFRLNDFRLARELDDGSLIGPGGMKLT